jgi:hypothetical protein
MSKTYKAVFECADLGERSVWWVSSRKEAMTHLRRHITTNGGKTMKRYKDAEWSLTLQELFTEKYEVFYNSVSSWGGS